MWCVCRSLGMPDIVHPANVPEWHFGERLLGARVDLAIGCRLNLRITRRRTRPPMGRVYLGLESLLGRGVSGTLPATPDFSLQGQHAGVQTRGSRRRRRRPDRPGDCRIGDGPDCRRHGRHIGLLRSHPRQPASGRHHRPACREYRFRLRREGRCTVRVARPPSLGRVPWRPGRTRAPALPPFRVPLAPWRPPSASPPETGRLLRLGCGAG
ncbi:hypothetical protein BMS3Abin02_00054 [bacterium BMS3Abin02]|nr:hypothetical protein BMS3Abin02_00054 [bacterium BMS3Abin02]